jgi:hypothetical protein
VFGLLVLMSSGCEESALPLVEDLHVSDDLSFDNVDLSVASFDLSVSVDLKFPNVDMGDFCAGTPLAATCAYSYFLGFAQSYQPMGRCEEFASPGVDHILWENCVRFEWQPGGFAMYGSPLTVHTHYVDGGFYETYEFSSGTLSFDDSTGVISCPGGAQATIGSIAAACPALDGLLHPSTAACDHRPDEMPTIKCN